MPMPGIRRVSIAQLLLGATLPLTLLGATPTETNFAIRGQLQRYEQAVLVAHEQVFATIELNIRFEIDEIQPLSRDWAFSRTGSKGRIKVLASDGPAGPEANQELFLFHRDADGQWRFARDIFATTNPPAGRSN